MPETSSFERAASRIPAELRSRRQWVTWRVVIRNGRKTKVPYQPNGQTARTDDPATWCSFEEAAKASPSRFDGIGFVFSADDPYVGIDFDNALDGNGQPLPWARPFLDQLPPFAYLEVSPSRTGLHAILRARKPGEGCRKKIGVGGLEIYEEKRYFTMTGDLIGPKVDQVPAGQEALEAIYGEAFGASSPDWKPTTQSRPESAVLDRAFRSRRGDKIRNLWRGSIDGYPSQSEADLALCSFLAIFADGDLKTVDRLFRRSGLMRPKWNRHDYRQRTLGKAASSLGGRTQQSRNPTPQMGAGASRPERTARLPFNPNLEPQNNLNHLGNAWRLAKRHHHELRFAGPLGHLVYDGRRWTACSTKAIGLASGLTRMICEEAAEASRQASETTDEDEIAAITLRAEKLNKWARASGQGPAIRESLKLTEPLLALDADQLDSDPLLLNVENGTLNLKTGQLQAHQRADFLTKLAPVSFDPDAKAPRWSRFVEECMGGDHELARYLQRALGYSITGQVREQCLFLAIGSGQNGKSTMLDAVRAVLGTDYVVKTAPDLLLASRFERNPSDIVDLRGARLAVCQESDDGKAFDVARLKELTGETLLKGRALYSPWLHFKATFKLWMPVNQFPPVRDSTTAFWRRLRIVPFGARIQNPDRDLGARLAGEKSGILNWLLRGAQAYFEEGLAPPPKAIEALRKYRGDSDGLGQFIAAECNVGSHLEVAVGVFREAYIEFCKGSGLAVISMRGLSREMESRGFSKSARRRNGYVYFGLSLRAV